MDAIGGAAKPGKRGAGSQRPRLSVPNRAKALSRVGVDKMLPRSNLFLVSLLRSGRLGGVPTCDGRCMLSLAERPAMEASVAALICIARSFERDIARSVTGGALVSLCVQW